MVTLELVLDVGAAVAAEAASAEFGVEGFEGAGRDFVDRDLAEAGLIVRLM
ncbi:hypothetical protein HNR02_006343 [Amycolatopsis endophytica]|uniref:Uncharacterized protein n=1 Tax=Amycolatopsis endophytica TaxID=860233 RepID=A0A853BC59_9PSEU|nr:hypothetical protein [Amycolatopsis endophytica]NYI92968.1 hypothetical protein [Amycolatopsis endophytica]